MRLTTKSPVFFILFIAIYVLPNRAYSIALSANPEEQSINSEKADNSAPALSNSTESKMATEKTQETISPTEPVDAKHSAEAADEAHHHDVIINAPTDAFFQQKQDIKHYLTQENISPLLVGTETYLIATNLHTSSINKGVMVLIPDWQQSLASPNALKQLRQNMPQHGWTTITLHPPSKPENYPSHAFTTEEQSTEDNETLTRYGKDLAEVMLAVIEKAKGYPGAIIVVVEGNHSAILLDLYQQSLIDAPSALVMLSSYMPTAQANEKIAQQLALTDYPILDLYLKRDNRLVLSNAKIRKEHAKRALKVSYRQKQLNNHVTGYYPKNTLTKEIINWLSTIGW